MTLVEIQKRLAELVVAKKEAEGLTWRAVGNAAFADNSANKIYRVAHPFERDKRGNTYGANWNVETLIGVLEWLGMTLGDLQPPTERTDAAALLCLIDQLEGEESDRLLLRSLVQSFCAQTGLGVSVDFTNQEQVA